jgi:hypothetical protein
MVSGAAASSSPSFILCLGNIRKGGTLFPPAEKHNTAVMSCPFQQASSNLPAFSHVKKLLYSAT